MTVGAVERVRPVKALRLRTLDRGDNIIVRLPGSIERRRSGDAGA